MPCIPHSSQAPYTKHCTAAHPVQAAQATAYQHAGTVKATGTLSLVSIMCHVTGGGIILALQQRRLQLLL